MKSIFNNIIKAYESWHFFNYFWIRPPEWLIDFFNFIWPKKNNRFIVEYFVKISNKNIHFLIDSKYEQRISDFLKNFNYSIKNNQFDKIVLVWWEDTIYNNECDVFFDLSDSLQLNKWIKCKKYIKRECSKKNFKLWIIPLPYIFSDNYNRTKELKNYNKEYDMKTYFISFWWQIKSANDNRKKYISLLKKYYWKRFHLYWASFEKHINILNDSKYAINLFWCWEYCTRFTEIANCNTLMLCQRYTIEIPNNFTDMENIVYFSSFEELVKKIEILDKNPDLYNKIYDWFKEHYKKYHTHEKYCEQLTKLITIS